MKRLLVLTYGFLCYGLMGAAVLWFAAFMSNFGLPNAIDRGVAGDPLSAALVDAALIALFGLQHSVMARAGFKRRWTRLIPPPIERSTYVLASSLALVPLIVLWRPLPEVIWNVEDSPLRWLIWALVAVDGLLLIAASLMIDHFELFGLRQVVDTWRGRATTSLSFRTPGLYRYVRHPLMTGTLLIFWLTPRMTAGHLLLALGMSAYILIGIHYEERDLRRNFGAAYEDYRRRTPMLFPVKIGLRTER